MILDFAGTKVDTEEDHEQHKKSIDRYMHCKSDEPRQFFTVKSPSPNSDDRYVNLVYNEDGSKLKKIYYWDTLTRVTKLEKRRKDQCYFIKEDCWETKEVTDFDAPRYSEHTIAWERDNPKYNKVNPMDYAYYPTPKKSRWKFW